MANPLKGEVAAAIGGEAFTFVLDINALIEIEDQVGLDLDAILAGLPRVSLKVDRAVLWAALQAHHAPCNLLRAGELLQQLGLKAAHALVIRLMAAAMPEVVKEKKPDPRKATGAAGTGNVS